MPRTPITPVQLVRDTGALLGNGATPNAVAGNIVTDPGPFKSIIVIKNGDSSSHTLLLRSGSYTGTPAGAANSSMVSPSNTVFTQSTVGDLSITVAATTTVWVHVNTTDRFTQQDGSMWLDWTASTSMTVWVLTSPYVVA